MNAYNTDPNDDVLHSRGGYDTLYMGSVTATQDIDAVIVNRISWGAVFAGVALALTSQLVFNLTGLGIGAATGAADPAAFTIGEVSVVTAIWWTVSGIMAAYIGGYTAGRLCGDPEESTAAWHGLTAWAASVLILAALILAGAGTLMGGMLSTVGLNTGAGIVALQASQGNGNAASAPAEDTANLEMSAQTLAQTEGIPLEEARTRVLNETAPSAGTTATPAPPPVDQETLSSMVTQGAALSVVALLLGAAAAWFGGSAGAVTPSPAPVREKRKLH